MENSILDNIQELNFNRHIIKPINEETFWEMVDDVKWYSLCKKHGAKSTEIFGKFLMERYKINDIAELQRIEVAKREDMLDWIKDFVEKMPEEERKQYKLDALESIDLASYIVGLGQTMYHYVKDNPTVILDLQNRCVACFEDGFDKAIYAMNFAE